MWVSLQSLILNPAHKHRFENCMKSGVSRIWSRFGQVFVADSHLRNLQIFSLNDASPPSQDAAIESLNLQSEIIHISFPVWCLDSFWIVTGDGLLQHFVKGDGNCTNNSATWRWKSSSHLLMDEENAHVTEVLVHDAHRAVYVVSCRESKGTCNIWKICALATGPRDVTFGHPNKILEECPLFSLAASSTCLYGWATAGPCPPNVFLSWSSTARLTVNNTSRQQWACASIRFRHACWEAVALWAQNPSKTISRILTTGQHLVVIDEEFQVSVLRESDGKTVRSFRATDPPREPASEDIIHVNIFRETLLVLRDSSLKMYPIFAEDNKETVSVPVPSRGCKVYASEDPAGTLYAYAANAAYAMWGGGKLRGGEVLDVLDGWVSMYEDGAEKFTPQGFRDCGHERLKPPLRVDAAVALGLARKRHDTMEARGRSCDCSEEMRRLLRDVLSERSGIFLRRQVVDVCERYASLIDAVQDVCTGVDP